jgi:hypothetical protein
MIAAQTDADVGDEDEDGDGEAVVGGGAEEGNEQPGSTGASAKTGCRKKTKKDRARCVAPCGACGAGYGLQRCTS